MVVNRTTVHGVILWLIALAAIITGYILTTGHVLDQQWMSRAGCLIVVLGIWSGLGGLIEEKILHRGLVIKKRMARHRVRLAFGADPDVLETELQKVEEKFDHQLNDLKNQLGISVGVLEASLLITGTVLWGFGDLIKYI